LDKRMPTMCDLMRALLLVATIIMGTLWAKRWGHVKSLTVCHLLVKSRMSVRSKVVGGTCVQVTSSNQAVLHSFESSLFTPMTCNQLGFNVLSYSDVQTTSMGPVTYTFFTNVPWAV
jgi:hypothetical protein